MLRRKRFWFAIMAILPTFAIFGWVRLFPIIETLRLSMHEWNLLSKNKPFVGFQNFIELFGDGILIFPNPSNGKIYIELKNHYFERLEITNPLGQIIYSSLIDNDYYEESVDLSKYGNGIYLINVKGDDRNQVFKLLISQ